MVKGAKDYFFLSTIVALVKAKLWPTQAVTYKQQVVERILAFTQTLFSWHANCEHLGEQGMGSFQNNQVCFIFCESIMDKILICTLLILGCLVHRDPGHGTSSTLGL